MAHPTTQLSFGDYASDLDDGSALVIPGSEVPGFDPNEFGAVAWFKPNWASTDTAKRYLFDLRINASNRLTLQWNGDGTARFVVTHGGSAVADISVALPSFSAGDEVFFGARVTGGAAFVYADTSGDGTLQSATDASVATFAVDPSAWTHYIGDDPTGVRPLDGSLNLFLLNTGHADPITARYNAGAGVTEATWLADKGAEGVPYGEQVVLRIGGQADAAEYDRPPVRTATYLPGGNGSDVTAPHVPAMNVAQPDMRAVLHLKNWSLQDRIILDKVDHSSFSTSGGYGLTAELGRKLQAYWSTGSTFVQATVSPNALPGAGLWAVRAVIVPDNGADVHEVQYSYKATTPATVFSDMEDDAGWIPLGTVTGGVSFIGANTNPLRIGARLNLGSNQIEGLCYAAMVKDNNGGVVVASPNFTHLHEARTSVVDAQGNEWTLHGDAKIVLDVDAAENKAGNGGMETWPAVGAYEIESSDQIDTGYDLSGVQKFTIELVTNRPSHLSAPANGATALSFGGTSGFVLDNINAPNGDPRIWIGGEWKRRNNVVAFLAGRATRVTITYDGTQAAGSRVKLYTATLDKDTGVWGAPTEQVLNQSSAGDFPTSIPSLAATLIIGNGIHAEYDHFALKVGEADDLATIQARNPLTDDLSSWVLNYGFDGNATNGGSGGSTYDGTVTGATQVADGRNSGAAGDAATGWTHFNANVESQRVNGEVGNYALAYLSGTGVIVNTRITGPDGKLYYARARGKDGAQVRLFLYGNASFLTPTAGSSWETMAAVLRAGSSGFDEMSLREPGIYDQVAVYEFADVTPTTDTRPVFRDLAADWGILELVGRNAALLWDIRELVNRDLPAAWDIRELVNRDLPAAWDIRELVNRDLPAAWDIRELVANDAAMAWAIRELVGRNAAMLWDIRELVARNLPADWDIRELVARNLPADWDIRELVARDAEFAWTVGVVILYLSVATEETYRIDTVALQPTHTLTLSTGPN